MIRTISWTIGDDMSITPHRVQNAGVQGDNNATEIEFTIPEDDFGGRTMYIELTDSTGGYDKTDALTPEDHKVSFLMPLAWTQAGGEATVRLVVTDGENGEDTETAYSFAGRIRFDTREVSHTVDSLIKGAIHWLMEKAASVLTSAETAASTATEKAGIATSAAEDALQSEQAALSSANAAAIARSGAVNYATQASSSATAAGESASAASASATAADASATAAEESAQAAEEAKEEIESGNYAKTDGYYEGMTVGMAENLIDTKAVGTSRSFTFDTACGDASITDDGTGTIAEIFGNTVVWNQIFKKTGADAGGVTSVYDEETCTLTMNGTMTGLWSSAMFQCGQFADDTILSRDGHLLLVGVKVVKNDDNLNILFRLLNQQSAVPSSGYFSHGTRSAIVRYVKPQTSPGNYMGFYVESGIGTVINDLQVQIMMFDLTAMFGAGNEPTTVAEFTAMFPRDFYARNTGELLNFSGTGLKTVGFNAYHDGEAELVGGHEYQITGAYTALTLNGETVTPSADGLFTPAQNGTLTVTGGDDTTCVHLVWSGYRDGEYEEYWSQTLSMPVAQYFPDGMKSAGAVHDSLFADKAITRVGTRAYQSGDESDSTVTTDGTHTNYALATPVTVSIAPPLNFHYNVADFGTEQLLPANGAEPTTSPLVGTVRYSADYPREIANLRDGFDAHKNNGEIHVTQQEKAEWNAEMVGATSAAAGQSGKVPEPAAGDQEKFLRGDGVWATPPSGGSDTAGVVAPAYSISETYSKDDLVIYDSLLYVANQDIDTPEAWTPAHWDQTTIDAVLHDYMKYSTLVITCLTQDGVIVTGQTVTVRKGSSASGNVYAQVAYDGQPVSVLIPVGFDYFVSISDTLDHHFNPTTATGVVNAGTINITLTYSDLSNIRTFPDVKAALNVGIDLTGLVGEQVSFTRQNKSLAFDVTDYDGESVWLLLHDTLPDQKVFEPGQALAWFENGLAAGDYCFTHSSKVYYFTLTKAIPEGGQLKATTSSFTTYASQNDSTALESGSVSETAIADATSIGTTATGDLNHMDRVNYGSNNAGESGLFAWLNSDAEPGINLPRINKFSRPYSSGSDGGFLNGIDADALACLEDVTWTVQANNVYEAPASMGGIAVKGQPYSFTGKFGLAKFANIGLSGSNPWDLYVGATNTDRIKYYNGDARTWWVIDALTNYANSEHIVYSSGGSGNYLAQNSYGAVPACKIKRDPDNKEE